MENFKKQIKDKEISVKIDFLLKLKKNEEWIYKIICTNLIKMRDVSKKNNVGIIFQMYPVRHIFNENIRKIAKRFRIPLVDNQLLFQKKLITQDNKDFFVADGHCNAKGYRIIAQNVYRILFKEGLIN